ncbi:MAG TPA: helix-turn-helix domain-containing protein [Bacillota bacterium]|nr:helix-turn-helix domain-containing protein [Bacillota bacterium]HOL10047.1 helix-turn-helix domain-containing protein [Bacillota bacterium]HPO98541.1 helix-turn-helix domain-containing protein [Bacillota bacterium]
MDELITADEVMRILKISRATLNRWVKAGKIQALKLGEGKKGAVRFRLKDIEAFVEENVKKD